MFIRILFVSLLLPGVIGASAWAQSAREYGVTLKSVHGKYVVAEPDGTANANRPEAAEWEYWQLSDLNGGQLESGDAVTLRGAHRKYLVAEPDGTANANRPQAAEWERWRVRLHDNGKKISFRGAHGKYLVAESDGTLNANRDAVGAWEQFELFILDAEPPQSVSAQDSEYKSIGARWAGRNFTIENRWRCPSSKGLPKAYQRLPYGEARTVPSDDRCGMSVGVAGKDVIITQNSWLRWGNAVWTLKPVPNMANRYYLYNRTGCSKTNPDSRCGMNLSFSGNQLVLVPASDTTNLVPWNIVPVYASTDEYWIYNAWRCEKGETRCNMSVSISESESGQDVELASYFDEDRLVPWRFKLKADDPWAEACVGDPAKAGRPSDYVDPDKGRMYVTMTPQKYTAGQLLGDQNSDERSRWDMILGEFDVYGCRDWRPIPPELFQHVQRRGEASRPSWGAAPKSKDYINFAPGGYQPQRAVGGLYRGRPEGRHPFLLYRFYKE